MIKLLHLADLHIGMENYGKIDSQSGLHSRLIDYLTCLDQAIDEGIDAQVDIVLIAGDIYKSRQPNPTHQREFATRMRRLVQAGIPIFIITGNHDVAPALGRAHSVEIFHALDVTHITIADRPKYYRFPTRSGDLNIIALPWVFRHALLTKDDMRHAPLSDIDLLIQQRLETFIREALHQCDPTLPTVLTAHATIDGAKLGAERTITLGQDMVFPRSLIARPGIDYVALGHIHCHQCMSEHPPIVYAGSIERIDFGERKEEKGYVLVELEPGAAKWRFCRLAARPFVLLEVDVRQSSDPLARVHHAIHQQTLQNAVVRVDVKVTSDQTAALSDEESLRQALLAEGASIIAGININVEREQGRGIGNYETMMSLTPRQTLEHYLQEKQMSPDRIANLLAAADELFAEEAHESI